MPETVHVVGVGMTPFSAPGRNTRYDVMGGRATRAALRDAWLPFDLIDQAYVASAHCGSTSGQAALHHEGRSGIPIINVGNGGAAGATALWLARQAVLTGAAECVLALGFEEVRPRAGAAGKARAGAARKDPVGPPSRFDTAMRASQPYDHRTPWEAQLFGGAAQHYADRYGLRADTLAKIVVKARRHGAGNPNALFRRPVTETQVLSSPRLFGPLTQLQAALPACGAAAAVVTSGSFARRHGLNSQVAIRGQSMVSDGDRTFSTPDMMALAGYDLTRTAAHQVYESSGVGPEDLQLAELYDHFGSNELIAYEALGLTPPGTAEKFVIQGNNTYGGWIVTNPSGGLLARGNAEGATGLAQCAEIVWQIREQATTRQVDGIRHALQHTAGLGGACVTTLYEKLG
jgi:acetyl-CoA acetyltransferase